MRSAIRIRQNVPEQALFAADTITSFRWGGQKIPLSSDGLASAPAYFIVSSGRSGNTLLRRLLMERFDTFIPPEIPGLGRCLRVLTKSRYRPWHVCVDSLVGQFVKSADISVKNPESGEIYNLLDELEIDPVQMRAELAALPADQRSLQRILTSLYGAMLEKSSYSNTKSTIIGDKTPWNAFYLMHINRYLPDSKFIHLVRHPLAVAYSYNTGLSAITGGSIEDGARRWVTAVSRCLALQNQKSSASFSTVSYESLTEEPENQVQSLSTFLSLTRHATKNRKTWTEITTSDSKLIQHKRINQPVDSSSVEKWKCAIDPQLRSRLGAIVLPTVEQLARETNIDYSDAL